MGELSATSAVPEPATVSCFGARHSVHLCDLINTKKEHKKVGTRLTIMLRGPGNVVGRCLKPLNTSAKRAEHSLAVYKRHAYFVHLCDQPPVVISV